MNWVDYSIKEWLTFELTKACNSSHLKFSSKFSKYFSNSRSRNMLFLTEQYPNQANAYTQVFTSPNVLPAFTGWRFQWENLSNLVWKRIKKNILKSVTQAISFFETSCNRHKKYTLLSLTKSNYRDKKKLFLFSFRF